ncbi:synaptosomal-associated protein 25 [Parasteatoda tepidariorum]|uniref:synaptosomal-associated protein 25 n=1 Tax=Parasteatoda tepidariorum TaxID=114398 RepID=UPI00077F98A7|nr:synaptosomal-associated protein 25 [Parasteatoda tepidariorum]
MSAGGPTELEVLQMKANQITDDSLESTRRMVRLAEESEAVGMKTITMLNDQGEQLDRIEEDMDVIHTDMREAEKNLTGMEKCCGLCVCPCAKAADFRDDSRAWRSNEDGKIINSQPARVVDNRNGAGPTGGAFVSRITNDAREDEMEENMQQVSSVLGNLKNMALDMGNEIDSQNVQVDRINMKAQSNETHIVNANARASELLKK